MDKKTAAEERKARLAAELRENLKRRKRRTVGEGDTKETESGQDSDTGGR